MKSFFNKSFCIAAALLLVLCAGCKKENTASTTDTKLSEITADDLQDPENTELSEEHGAEMAFKQPIIKEGKSNGIDVSKWQGKIDWSLVKKSGIDFAIIRIGFRGENGIIYKDSCADYNLQQAEKAGVLTGVYFFSTAISKAEALEEAKWTVKEIAGYSISYPVVYDCEGFLSSESRMWGISSAQRTDSCLEFLKYVTDSSYEGMIYSAKSELENSKYWDTDRLESYKIFLARYPAVPYPETEHPDYSGRYDMWQYTDRGAVNGISGNVDMVVSYFTCEKSAPKNQSSRPAVAEPPSETDSIYTPADDEVTAKIEVNLRSSATTKSEVVGVLKNGDFLRRTGIGSNGWSRLVFGDKTVYAITSYLTKDRGYKPPEADVPDGFSPADGEVTAKEETNLRAEPSVSSQLLGTIKNGEFVTRTGTNPNGWTRVIYGGQTAYAKTNLLTTTVTVPPEAKPEPPAEVDGFTAAGGNFTAKETTNLRTAPSTVGSQIVHKLLYGEFAERIGYNTQSGWTKLSYNGQTVYAVTSFLISEEDYNTLENEKQQ